MNILLTGHLGFVGSRLYEELMRFGKVTGYDILEGCDINDRLKLEYVFETGNFDCVVHCAALTGARRGEKYPNHYFKTNAIGTFNVVQMAEKYGVEKFIHFSSSSVQDGKPDTIYGMSKYIGERIVERSMIQKKIILRPFTLIAEHGRPDQLLERWLSAAAHDKVLNVHGWETERNFTFLGDIIKLVSYAIQTEYFDNGMIYELRNPESITLREIADMIRVQYPTAFFRLVGLDKHELKQQTGRWDSPFEPTPVRKIIERIIKKYNE